MSRNNINQDPATSGVNRFIELIDCPNSYAGQALNYAQVNVAQTGLQFAPGTGGPATDFVSLTDGPMNYGTAANQFLTGNLTNAVLWKQPAFLDLSDTPNTYSGQNTNRVIVNAAGNALVTEPDTFITLQDVPASYLTHANQTLQVNGAETGIHFVTVPPPLNAFTTLTDVIPGGFVGHAGDIVIVDPTETFLTYTTNQPADTFLGLTDVLENTYIGKGGEFVRVALTENGLEFITASTATSLLALTDNTGPISYSNATIGLVPQANILNTGWTLASGLTMQTYCPRLVQNFIKRFKNPPSYPTFIYNDSDGILPGGCFYFGCWRTNYNDPPPPYLNQFWTSEQQTGSSNMYDPNFTSGMDIEPSYVGIGLYHHSPGAQFNIFGAQGVNTQPPYTSWVFDVDVNFNATLKLGNIDDNIFCVYICTELQLSLIMGGTQEQRVARADYWIDPGNGNRFNVNISKVITLHCQTGNPNPFPSVNVYMIVYNQNNFSQKGSFTVQSYDYINASYKVLGVRPSTNQYTLENPGIFW